VALTINRNTAAFNSAADAELGTLDFLEAVRRLTAHLRPTSSGAVPLRLALAQPLARALAPRKMNSPPLRLKKTGITPIVEVEARD
jgi:hypothetical protein